ncbi:MAG: HEAT repeat domain-containing protein, partial [Hymenobacter sp.]
GGSNAAALRPFLTDKNAAYRAAAALAFGSVQDKAAVPALAPLLADKSPAVRRAAAFALGQTGDSLAVPALTARLGQPEANAPARRATYEALGRCVSRRQVAGLWQAPAAGPDSATANGRAWALYRAALRGLGTAEVVGQAAALLARSGPALAPARAGASAALARVRGQDSALARVARPVLLKGLATDPSYYVRVNCASALGRIATRPGVLGALLSATTDADFRVRVAALRALPITRPATSPEERRGSYLEAALSKALALCSIRVQEIVLQPQASAQEALTGAEWFLRTSLDTARNSSSVRRGYAGQLQDIARQVPYFRARATVLQAALRQMPSAGRPMLADTIRSRYQRTTNQYEKAALLTALSEDPAQFNFLAKEATLTTGPPVVPGAALAALVALRENKRFPAARQADFTAALHRALAGGAEL